MERESGMQRKLDMVLQALLQGFVLATVLARPAREIPIFNVEPCSDTCNNADAARGLLDCFVER